MRVLTLLLAAWTTSAAAVGSEILLVVNKSSDNVSLHQLAGGRELARLSTGPGPHEVAASPDGRRAVVTNYGSSQPGHTLTVVDLAGKKVERSIDLGEHRRPHGVAFLPDSRRVAVTTEGSAHLLVVDVVAGKIERAIPTGQEVSHMVALSPDASRAYVANIGSGSLTVIDLAAGKVLRQVATGAGAEGVAVARDGAEIWVSNRAVDSISVVDARTFAVSATLPSPGFPIRVVMTPDGRHALVSNAKSGELAVFDVAARRELQRIKLVGDEPGFSSLFGSGSFPVGITPTPDGRRVLVAITGGDRIAVVDAEHWRVREFWAAGDEPDGMAVVPAARASPVPRR